MPRAICEDCGSLVEAELTHNGICAVGHYVHCGWGHELSLDDLISDGVATRIEELEAKLAKAVELALVKCPFRWGTPNYDNWWRHRRTTLAELKGEIDE
jgi:hypothetical protein